VIHPSQIETVASAFAPSPDEIAHAEAVLAALERAENGAEGAVALDGSMVDEPVRLAALRTLARAGRTVEAVAVSALDSAIEVAGPYYEELEVGQRFDAAPGLTLTDGTRRSTRRSWGIGSSSRSTRTCVGAVVGVDVQLGAIRGWCATWRSASPRSPPSAWIANLFYRGLVLRRAPRIGDTLRTTTEVSRLRDVSARPGQAPRGLAALRVRTVDQHEREVLDFHRCAMLPMRDEAARPATPTTWTRSRRSCRPASSARSPGTGISPPIARSCPVPTARR